MMLSMATAMLKVHVIVLHGKKCTVFRWLGNSYVWV